MEKIAIERRDIIKEFNNNLEYFLIDNFNGINNKLEFENNIFHFQIDGLNIEYNINSLKSNVSNNCLDDIIVYHDYLELTERRENMILNSSIFKELERKLYDTIQEIEGLLNRYIYENDCYFETVDYIELNSDMLADAYCVFAQEVLERRK